MKYPETKRDAVVDDVHGVQDPRSLSLARRRARPEVKAWMAAEDKQARSLLARAARARQAARALQGAVLPRDLHAAAPLRRPLLLHAAAQGQGEGDRLLEGGRRRRRAGAARSRTRCRPTARRRSACGTRRGTARRVVYGLKPNNSDETILHVMDVATRQGLRRRRHRRRQVRRPVVDARRATASTTRWVPPLVGQGARRPSGPATPSCAFTRSAADPATRPGACTSKTGNPQTFLGGCAVAATATGCSSPSSTAGTRTDVYFRDLREQGRPRGSRSSSASRSQYGVDVRKDAST